MWLRIAHRIITVYPNNFLISNTFCLETRKASGLSPRGKKMEAWAAAPAPWHGRKIEFSSPDARPRLPLPVYFVHSAVTCGVAKASLLCIVIGVGRILKMLPLSP